MAKALEVFDHIDDMSDRFGVETNRIIKVRQHTFQRMHSLVDDLNKP